MPLHKLCKKDCRNVSLPKLSWNYVYYFWNYKKIYNSLLISHLVWKFYKLIFQKLLTKSFKCWITWLPNVIYLKLIIHVWVICSYIPQFALHTKKSIPNAICRKIITAMGYAKYEPNTFVSFHSFSERQSLSFFGIELYKNATSFWLFLQKFKNKKF